MSFSDINIRFSRYTETESPHRPPDLSLTYYASISSMSTLYSSPLPMSSSLYCSTILLYISSTRLPYDATGTPLNTDHLLITSKVPHPDSVPTPHDQNQLNIQYSNDDHDKNHNVEAKQQKSKVMSAYHVSYWDAEDRAAVERTAAQLAALGTSLKDQAFR